MKVTLTKCRYDDIIEFIKYEYKLDEQYVISLLYGDGDGILKDHHKVELELGELLDGNDMSEFSPDIEDMDYDDIPWMDYAKFLINKGHDYINAQREYTKACIMVSHFMISRDTTHLLVDCRR